MRPTNARMSVERRRWTTCIHAFVRRWICASLPIVSVRARCSTLKAENNEDEHPVVVLVDLLNNRSVE